MPSTEQRKLLNAIKNRKEKGFPWGLFSNQQIAYDDNKYRYALRLNTSTVAVRLYYPLIRAAAAYTNTDKTCDYMTQIPNYSMIATGIGASMKTTVEALTENGTTILVQATATELRCTVMESDGTQSPAISYDDMAKEATQDGGTFLFAICMALIPHIIHIEEQNSSTTHSALTGKMVELGTLLEQAKAPLSFLPAGTPAPAGPASPNLWQSENDFPDAFKEAAYFLDGAMAILTDHMTIKCAPTGASVPEMIAGNLNFTGGEYNCNRRNGWAPKYLTVTGSRSQSVAATMTIKDARDSYGAYSQGRNWTAQERMLIPALPDDMPVMPEVLRIAQRIIDTEGDINPVVNVMWRAGTGYGKTTGTQQLAAILNMPLLKFTCDPSTETQDFKSQFVPAGSDAAEGILLDTNNFLPGQNEAPSADAPAALSEALAHYASLDEADKEKLLRKADFFDLAFMDTDAATLMLTGNQADIPLAELCSLYTAFCAAIETMPMKQKMAEMAAVASQEKPADKPEFVHVVSPYLKGMVNGYVVEIQEASRIRSSGVLVGLNNFDRPGGVMPLMNGALAKRHEKSICCFTDNTGYESCRNLDPSVLRRMGMIIDSDELTKEQLFDRTRRNTGVTDNDILKKCYDLWKAVKDYCKHNSITEGTVSSVEFELFVQATKYDGLDMLPVNLNDCVISKASSKPEDQKDMREACAVLLNA